MKANDIKTKCLPVVENIDEFSTKLEDIDQNIEDYCAYITSLADIYYWLSIETIWGKMGFQWDVINERGHFTKTTLPFSIIPKIPDGHRIKSLKGLLSIERDTIIIQKSNWENLNDFGGLILANSYERPINNLYADFSGANFTKQSGEYPYKELAANENYIKADFKNLTRMKFEPMTSTHPKFIIDDNNKYLNCPMNLSANTELNIVWKGEGPYKDEYIFNITTNTVPRGSVSIFSENNKYHIKNFIRSYASPSVKCYYTSYNVNIIKEIINNPESVSYIDLTIEMVDGKTDINDFAVLDKTTYNWYRFIDYSNIDSEYKVLNLNIIGEFDKILAYKLDTLVLKQYGEFEQQFDISILPKITYENINRYRSIGIFANSLFDYIPDYTWDVKDLNTFCVFDQSVFYLKDILLDKAINRRLTNGTSNSSFFYIKEPITVFKIKNTHSNLHLYLPRVKIYDNKGNVLSNILMENFEYNCDILDTHNYATADTEYICPNTTKLKLNKISNKIKIILLSHDLKSVIIDAHTVKNIPTGRIIPSWEENHKISTEDKVNIFDVINFDSDAINNLKQSIIDTSLSTINFSVTIIHPLILSNVTPYASNTIYTNVKFIYKSICDFSSIIRGQTFIDQLLVALEPNDSTSTYTITLRNEDYLLLTQEQIEYITITCNYVLVNKIV